MARGDYSSRYDEHDPDAKAKRIVSLGLTSGGDYQKQLVDESGRVVTGDAYMFNLKVKREVVGGNLRYEGFAEPGTSTSEAGWLIRRYTWNDGVPDIDYANGEAKFNQIWDNRAGLSYS